MTLNSARFCKALPVLAAALLATGTSHAAPANAADDPPHLVRVAGLFGESDEEKAARLAAQQREQAQDAALATLTEQVGQLQSALRDVTGQVEDARHQNVLLKDQIAKMQKDFEYRICQLSAQTFASGDAGGPAVDCSAYGGNGGVPAAAMPAAPGSGGQMMGSGQSAGPGGAPGGIQMGRPPGILGYLPASGPTSNNGQSVTVDMSSVGGAPAGGVNSAASGAANAQYKAAMDLLAQGRYGEAGAAFQAFADANPNAPQAPQAVYWVGSVAYVQKDYAGAARAFAQEIKLYPKADTAPQSMLRLGQSLIAMKQKQEGCSALAALRVQYPHASASVRDEAAKAHKDAGCR